MANRVRRNHVLNEKQAKAIDDKSEEWGVDKSFIVRRAVNFYMAEGHKRDKILKREMEGDM